MRGAPAASLRASIWRPLVVLGLGGLFYLAAVLLVHAEVVPNTDFFTFWLAGHLAGLGQNLYSADVWTAAGRHFGATWIPNASFVYPLPVGLMFVPLGWLSPYHGALVWRWLSLVMVACSLALLLRLYPPDIWAKYVLPLAAGLAAFHPLMLTILNGQLGPLLLLTLTSVAYLWSRDKWWQGALLLPLLAFKPNLGAPLCLLLTLFLLFRRQYVAVVAAGASATALAFLGWLQDPAWIVKFWATGSNKLSQSFGISPTVWGVSSYLCGLQRACGVRLGVVLGLLVLVLAAFILFRSRQSPSPLWFAGFAACVTLLLTPYTWSYDQLLLAIPIITVALDRAEAGAPFLFSALFFIAVDALAFALLWVAGVLRLGVWSAMLPLALLIALGAAPSRAASAAKRTAEYAAPSQT